VVAHDVATPSMSSPEIDDCDLLTVATGHDGFDIFELRSEVTTVGRHEDAAIVLDDISVSRRHALFQRTASGRITVRDLNSLNGTYVNGARVEETVVRSGDEIQIGKYKIVFWGCES
jgi:pSer/pThr/pTyr-binding forkhead associated (FHA) protein